MEDKEVKKINKKIVKIKLGTGYVTLERIKNVLQFIFRQAGSMIIRANGIITDKCHHSKDNKIYGKII